MTAAVAARGTAAFKNGCWFKKGGLYLPSSEKTDGQVWYLRQGMYGGRIYLQGFQVGPVNRILCRL